MTRQQRRAEQRQRTKHPTKAPSMLQISVAAALHPTLWRPSTPTKNVVSAIDCTTDESPDCTKTAAAKTAGRLAVKETKTCTKCKEPKPLSEYHRSRHTDDGLQPYCKLCVAKAQARSRAKAALEPQKPAKVKWGKAGQAAARDARRQDREDRNAAEERNLEKIRHDRYKHCETCGRYLAESLYRRDPRGVLFGRADSCTLCEKLEAIERGEIRPDCPDVWRQQKPQQKEELIQPLPDHQRHTSGFPMNPFTGQKKDSDRIVIDENQLETDDL
ncbi:hypothetical protein [Paraburkholderia terrae]|uniref:hypothetical protein n=1 Tax=Paraburkholderia terrae TaxID=311230 RepID=UPI001EE1E5F2|nr:hypothetical protein [Paraburkholderia terrae]GJH02267.1 hypothetical protein CBA19C8_16940 [Paraburkholderia terrae]